MKILIVSCKYNKDVVIYYLPYKLILPIFFMVTFIKYVTM